MASMAATEAPDHVDQHDYDEGLAGQTKGLSLNDDRTEESHYEEENGYPNGDNQYNQYTPATENMDRSSMAPRSEYEAEGAHERPRLPTEPSRSYMKPIPIVTTYEEDTSEPVMNRRKSAAPSTRAPSVKRSVSRPASVRQEEVAPPRAVSRASTRFENQPRPVSRAATNQEEVPVMRPASRAASVRSSRGNAVGEVMTPERQRELQGVSLHDGGAVPHFEEGSNRRSTSPRPQSAFGYRPQPNLLAVTEEGYNENGRESRAGVLDRSGTVMSRANTLGRNGTLSRAANGGTVGSRRGAFGRGAGASIGTQPEEVLGRDDIHTRAELSERILDDATLRRLANMEKKDAKRLSKVLKSEGKAEAAAVKGSIKELERLSNMQKQAASAERKSQLRLGKYTSKEHKARLRFLKEKERYEKVEADLRNAENDYEERRDHAAGLTAQVAEKTQELDDLRGQKAADDREREVKLLALKNPGHS